MSKTNSDDTQGVTLRGPAVVRDHPTLSRSVILLITLLVMLAALVLILSNVFHIV